MRIVLLLIMFLCASHAFSDNLPPAHPRPIIPSSLTLNAIANALGWVPTTGNRCQGYYLESAFTNTNTPLNDHPIQLDSPHGFSFSLKGTSLSQGNVKITQDNAEITAQQGYLYRDPVTGKLTSLTLSGNIILREPDELVHADTGYLELKTKHKWLSSILYRKTIYPRTATKDNHDTQVAHKVSHLSAWGQATAFIQEDPKISVFEKASYSTCPPLHTVWQLKASKITLNKYTQRGSAQHAFLFIQGIPIFYTPYFSFPLDDQRKTGFLSPTIGHSSSSGATVTTPFYWNIAPNLDDTLTPAFLSDRGAQLNNTFRYLTLTNNGKMELSVLPSDSAFKTFKQGQVTANQGSTVPATQAELTQLQNTSTSRHSFSWQNDAHYNEHWSSDVNVTEVGDDYYLTDFNQHIDQDIPNNLLRQARLNYQGQYWQFLTNVQGYQTLHPINQNAFTNQYTRLPQLVLNGHYRDENTGLAYQIENDLSNFTITQNPGAATALPMGTRLHMQPGISFPFYRPDFYITPEIQMAMTGYEVRKAPSPEGAPSSLARALPIVTIDSGLYFDRNISLFNHELTQTLEPKLYYTYIPYRYQDNLPIFDTGIASLTYDQLFLYNRFSGIDRIGDTNQIGLGLTTRFIDPATGAQKIYAGIGELFYLEPQRVSLYSLDSPTPSPPNPGATSLRSPISGVVQYNLSPEWSLTSNTTVDSTTNQPSNETLTVGYTRNPQEIINLNYTYALNGDPQVINTPSNAANNLSQTDINATWDLTRDWSAVGRWTENWNTRRLQNVLFGLQYSSCCWSVRFLAGDTFSNVTSSGALQYNTEYMIQFALKGLGSIGTGDSTDSLLGSGLTNYQSSFGQDY